MTHFNYNLASLSNLYNYYFNVLWYTFRDAHPIFEKISLKNNKSFLFARKNKRGRGETKFVKMQMNNVYKEKQ